jgi:hypothetical protein
MNLRNKVDPKLAKAIEADMADQDNKVQTKQQTKADTVESVACECVATGWKPGLLDDRTLCPKCQGTAKVAQLAQG